MSFPDLADPGPAAPAPPLDELILAALAGHALDAIIAGDAPSRRLGEAAYTAGRRRVRPVVRPHHRPPSRDELMTATEEAAVPAPRRRGIAVRAPASDGIPAKLAYAKALAESGLLPGAYRKQPANVLWATGVR